MWLGLGDSPWLAGGFAAASVTYPTAAKDIYLPGHRLRGLLAGACSVVETHGATDPGSQVPGQRLDTVVTRAGLAHDIKTCPDAGHSFLSYHHPRDVLAFWAAFPGRSRLAVPSAIGRRRALDSSASLAST